MSKWDVTILIFVIIACVGLFGAHFGYETDGVPQITGEVDYSQAYYQDPMTEQWYYIDPITGYFVQVESPPDAEYGAGDLVQDAMGFFLDMITFQVDGVPVGMTVFFGGLSLLALLLAAYLVRGN